MSCPNAGREDAVTFWNGERTPARVVRVIVGTPMRPTWWFAGLEGTEREAVRVDYLGDTFYLDNVDGSGWCKVTCGHGSPQYGHRDLTIAREVAGDKAEAPR
jgi:hypothetical protein